MLTPVEFYMIYSLKLISDKECMAEMMRWENLLRLP